MNAEHEKEHKVSTMNVKEMMIKHSFQPPDTLHRSFLLFTASRDLILSNLHLILHSSHVFNGHLAPFLATYHSQNTFT